MSALTRFRHACKSGPAACLTAWDYPTALLADHAGIDLILIGDSTAIVSLGLDSTASITLYEMIYHCRAVSRAVKNAFKLGDLPLGSYEVCAEDAVRSALRLVKEGGVDGVKLEGGREVVGQVRAITNAGVPLVGHIGLMPQRALVVVGDGGGGDGEEENDRLSFGSTSAGAKVVLEDALALQEAGAIAILMEAVAEETATYVTGQLRVPTIGIGCGNGTSAQMGVQSEVLGYLVTRLGRWHKAYANVGEDSVNALKKYKEECKSRVFPGKEHGYDMKDGEKPGV